MSPVVEWKRYISGPIRDSHGVIQLTFAPLVRIDFCIFDPGTSYEPRGANTNRVMNQPTLFVPTDKGKDIKPQDFILIDGKEYDVEGYPENWFQGQTGWDPGYVVVTLRRIEG